MNIQTSEEFSQQIRQLEQGSRFVSYPHYRASYFLETGQYIFLMHELNGIWDEKATIEQRLARASFVNYVLPETDSYALDIGLVPWNKQFPGADVPYLSALN